MDNFTKNLEKENSKLIKVLAALLIIYGHIVPGNVGGVYRYST